MRFELVAFDLYGTLLDVGGLAKRLERFAGPGAAELLARMKYYARYLDEVEGRSAEP